MPNRLSGSLAVWPAVSTSSMLSSVGVSSGSSFGLGGSLGVGTGFGVGVGLAAGFLVSAFSSSSAFFGSRGGVRGPGFVLVAARERYTTLRSPTPHSDRSASGMLTEYVAGGAGLPFTCHDHTGLPPAAFFASALSASVTVRRLFQPIHTPL